MTSQPTIHSLHTHTNELFLDLTFLSHELDLLHTYVQQRNYCHTQPRFPSTTPYAAYIIEVIRRGWVNSNYRSKLNALNDEFIVLLLQVTRANHWLDELIHGFINGSDIDTAVSDSLMEVEWMVGAVNRLADVLDRRFECEFPRCLSFRGGEQL